MKIAIIYDLAFPFTIGGGEKINWEVARRLAARGHDVCLVAPKMWEGPDVLERDGVRYVGTCRWLTALNNIGNRSPLQPFLFAASLLPYLRKNQFDVVACNAFPYLTCFTAKIAGWFNPAPMVINWYEARGLKAWTFYAGIFYGFFSSILEWFAARMSNFHNTISDYTADRMVKKLGIPREEIAVIPCGVDVTDVRPKTPVAKEKTLLYAGRMVRHKRVDRLIDAFAELAGEFPDYRLKLVGPGAEREALKQLAETKKLGDRIEFVDTLVGAPLYEEFQKASLFVLPSDQEGFGMVLIEAMAAQTPVIAKIAEFSAASTVIQSGENGLLFTTQAELVAAIRSVLSDAALRQRLVEGGEKTANSYDWETAIIPRMQQYLEAVSKRGQ